MKSFILSFVLVFSLCFPSIAQETFAPAGTPQKEVPVTGMIVIENDPGGSVNDEIKWLVRLEESKIPVVVKGQCVSACTLVLGLEEAPLCLDENAIFGFHAAFDVTKNNELLRDGTIQMAKLYPAPLRDWFMDHIIKHLDDLAAQHKPLVNTIYWLTAKELQDMGVAHICKDSGTPPADNKNNKNKNDGFGNS